MKKRKESISFLIRGNPPNSEAFIPTGEVDPQPYTT